MAIYEKQKLSGSTNGKQIKLAATSTPGTTVHTAVSGTTDYDEVWLYVTNNHTASVNLTIEWGGTSSPDDLIQMSIPSKTGLYLIVPGLVLQNGLAAKAFASVANVLCISGWVNRITA
jgi:hypothetical protein